MIRRTMVVMGVLFMGGGLAIAGQRSRQVYLHNIGSDSSRVQRMFWRAAWGTPPAPKSAPAAKAKASNEPAAKPPKLKTTPVARAQ